MSRLTGTFVALAVLSLAVIARGDEPAYMQVHVGQTAEIKGEWSKDSTFIAEEIELLPDSRRPKLRGAIEFVDSTRNAIRLFGQWITVTPSTQFLDVTNTVVAFSNFEPKQRVEISCKIDSAGQWTARHLRLRNVKSSDKIKGTVTRVGYDGKAPDTVIIETLQILVSDKTEVFRTLGGSAEAEADPDDAGDTLR